MAEQRLERRLFRGLEPERVRANVREVRDEIAAAAAAAGRDAAGVQVLAAVKYLPAEELPALAQAGIELVGENRAQELERKQDLHRDLFSWDFIGQLQSRKVRMIAKRARLIHSVASESALRELAKHGREAPQVRILLEVNVAGEAGKAGIDPAQIDLYIERAPVPVLGLMTMPPLARDPEHSRRWFATLRELAAARDLPELSMGTTQDYAVAVQEGATIVRIGTRLYR